MDQTSCGKSMEPIGDRWAAFGWQVREIDGHDMAQICDALDWAETNENVPSLIVARTVKGKGISFMEGRPQYHNAALTEAELAEALAELEAQLKAVEEHHG